MITYVDAQGVTRLVRFDRDHQTRWTFNVQQWEIGVRSYNADDRYPGVMRARIARALAGKGGWD